MASEESELSVREFLADGIMTARGMDGPPKALVILLCVVFVWMVGSFVAYLVVMLT